MAENRDLESISFMAQHLERNNIRSAIKCMLIELCIPTGSVGYRCLVDAVEMYYADPEQSLTKEVYPAVGRCTGQGNGIRVEKNVRDAITAAWREHDPEVWAGYFPKNQKPTNGQFISRIAEMLDIWQAVAKAKK